LGGIQRRHNRLIGHLITDKHINLVKSTDLERRPQAQF
jgi:hypothetical protein